MRFTGEPVAVVVAADRYIARDAADAIVVSYDALPAVVDTEQAMMKPTQIHKDFPNNLALPLIPSGTGVAPDGSAVDDRHQQGVCRGGGRDLAAHAEPSAGTIGDGAAWRGRALRAGKGR